MSGYPAHGMAWSLVVSLLKLRASIVTNLLMHGNEGNYQETRYSRCKGLMPYYGGGDGGREGRRSVSRDVRLLHL